MSKLETRKLLLQMPDNDIEDYIRERLISELKKRIGEHVKYADFREHIRFDMSGYGIGDNDCYFNNLDILKLFTDCGIWDYVTYLYLDAYKGDMILYWRWWLNSSYDQTSYTSGTELQAKTTTEIIVWIIKTLFLEPIGKGWTTRRFI